MASFIATLKHSLNVYWYVHVLTPLVFQNSFKWIVFVWLHRLAAYPAESANLFPTGPYNFEIRIETDVRHVYRGLQRLLLDYKDEKRGPTFISVQSCQGAYIANSSLSLHTKCVITY